MLNRKSFGRLIASAVLGAGLLAVGTVPAQATGNLGGSVAVVEDVDVDVETKTVCKTVIVLAKSAPTITVTIGGKPHTVNVGAFAAGASVKICVQVGANAEVVVTADVAANTDRCPIGAIVTGNIHVGASANGGGTFVEVTGLDKLGKPLTISTDKLHSFPAGTAVDVPVELVVCDP